MNSQTNKRARRCAIAVALATAAAAIGLWVLYRVTKYVPLFTAANILALPAVLNLILSLRAGEGEAKEPAPPQPQEMPAAPDGNGKKGRKRILRAVVGFFRKAGAKSAGFFRARYIPVVSVLSLLALALSVFAQVVMLRRLTSLYRASYLYAVLLIVLFVIFIVLDKIARHAEEDCRDEEKITDAHSHALLRNVRSALACGRLALLLILPCMVIRLLGFYELQKFLSAALTVIFAYVVLLTVWNFITRVVRRELTNAPDLHIPVPFSGGADLGFISYLEENTGITMRRLWSLKLMRSLIPYAFLFIVLLLWGSTGIVQIEADAQGALYRFGRLQDEPLSPGLHLVLPYPFDKVSVYDTGTVKKFTVGYRSEEDNDNLWTATHGTDEFRLLLGGGNEVVSINLRIEYKISDLVRYLRGSSEPERLLEAYSYELITQRTISTDLDTLLSADRDKLSEEFAGQIREKAAESNTGIEIVSVVLESIHPPIEIAAVYQNLIGAEVLAQKYILQAEGTAAVRLAQAEAQRDSALAAALSEQATRIAGATSDVAQFEAAVAANGAYPDAFSYYKYLKAISSAYGNAKLIIVGDGVDSSRIYFGSLGDVIVTGK